MQPCDPGFVWHTEKRFNGSKVAPSNMQQDEEVINEKRPLT